MNDVLINTLSEVALRLLWSLTVLHPTLVHTTERVQTAAGTSRGQPAVWTGSRSLRFSSFTGKQEKKEKKGTFHPNRASVTGSEITKTDLIK